MKILVGLEFNVPVEEGMTEEEKVATTAIIGLIKEASQVLNLLSNLEGDKDTASKKFERFVKLLEGLQDIAKETTPGNLKIVLDVIDQ